MPFTICKKMKCKQKRLPSNFDKAPTRLRVRPNNILWLITTRRLLYPAPFLQCNLFGAQFRFITINLAIWLWHTLFYIKYFFHQRLADNAYKIRVGRGEKTTFTFCHPKNILICISMTHNRNINQTTFYLQKLQTKHKLKE